MTVRDAAAHGQLGQGLLPALRSLQRQRGRAAAQRAMARLSARAPLLALLLLLVALVLSRGVLVPWWAPAAAMALLAALFVLAAALRARWHAVRPLDAALACDRAHDNKDRLAAALELSGGEVRAEAPLAEALAAAAIEDGVDRLRQVDARQVAGAGLPPRPRPLRALLSLLLLAGLTALLPAPAPAVPPPAGPAAAAGNGTGGAPARVEVAASGRQAGPAAEPAQPRLQPEPARGPEPKRSEAPPPAKAEPTPAVPAASGAGKSGSDEVGDSAQSGAPKAAPSASPGSGRPGGGQGSAAAGAPEPAPEQPRPAAPPKPKPKAPSKPVPEQEQKASESAGSPSGPSRGSGRMSPVGNKRQDLNRGMERDDDPDIEDEPIEDESDEQEQRGGITPMKRQDQRPAARELSISADGPPDQGRGGPTPPKKSRGTASLVLGLRLPDQIRGQPNPGTAKTSMEQIPPRRQQGDVGLALPAQRGRLGTPQSRRPVAGAVQLLLQAYHARLDQRDPNPTPPNADSQPSR